MLGGHVVKTGLAPVLIELMRRGIVTHVADERLRRDPRLRGRPLRRHVGGRRRRPKDGTFGMADETGREMNTAFVAGMRDGLGMGSRSVSRSSSRRARQPELSLLLAARRLGIPLTVHCRARRGDHPSASRGQRRARSATPATAISVASPARSRLDDGGVVLNLGSAVIMPEVFLKALTIARNLGAGSPNASRASTSTCSATIAPR
jgi:hypothetical protein